MIRNDFTVVDRLSFIYAVGDQRCQGVAVASQNRSLAFVPLRPTSGGTVSRYSEALKAPALFSIAGRPTAMPRAWFEK